MIHIGIDGNGTLYKTDGTFDKKEIHPLLSAFRSLKGKAKLYHLTGRDIEYIETRLRQPYPEVIGALHYHLLENGGVFYDGKDFRVLSIRDGKIIETDCDSQLSHQLNRIFSLFEARGIPREHVKVRHTSIEYAVPDDNTRVKELKSISEWLEEDIFPRQFYATMGAVAIYVNQIGIDKWMALGKVSKGETTCAIGDSMNDYDSISQATYGFLPGNAALGLMDKLTAAGFSIRSLAEFNPNERKVIYKSESKCTAAVAEILGCIRKHLLPNETDFKHT
ncbi:HAD hydrolase family protein [Candidatus Woesearchaeota archaeon]|nr:HAD hydrolase family protein [Candidatus Woesearchaeota archaeon]